MRGWLAGAALAAWAMAQQPGATPGSNVMHPDVHQQAQIVLMRMHTLNLDQIAAGRQAAQRGTTARVRRLGTLVARDHALEDKKVLQIARKNALALNPGPNAPTPAPVPTAPAWSGDAAFLQTLVRQDTTALDMLPNAARQTPVARLKDLIHDVVPIVKQEQSLAQDLQGEG